MELIDTAPAIQVDPAEYKRLLGYPRDYEWEGRSRELAEWAQAWYAENGHPWIYARQAANSRSSKTPSVSKALTSFRRACEIF